MDFINILKALNDLFRSAKIPFRVGEKTVLNGLAVEVIGIDKNNLPTAVKFVFDVPLEDNSLYWYEFNYRKGSFVRFAIPEVGETVEIAAPPTLPFFDAIKYVLRQTNEL